MRGQPDKRAARTPKERAPERRLTAAQSAQVVAAAEQALEFQKTLLKARAGELFEPATELIRAAREARDQQLP
jgi:hypothetical protein